MAYTRVNWKDYPDTTTPVNATNLNQMDEGIAAVDQELTTQKETATDMQDTIDQLNTGLSELNLKMDSKQNSEWKLVSDFASIPTAEWNEMIIHHFTGTVEYSMTTHITARMVSDAKFYPFYAGFYFSSNAYGGACIGIKKGKETTEFMDYGFQINNQPRTHYCSILYR